MNDKKVQAQAEEFIAAYTTREGGPWRKVHLLFPVLVGDKLNYTQICSFMLSPTVFAIKTDKGNVYDFLLQEWRKVEDTVAYNPEDSNSETVTDTNTTAGETSVDSIGQILAERGSRYGAFSGHAFITQNLKDAMKNSPNWDNLNVSQKEALEMMAHKIGRILNGDPNYLDSWVDIVGYTQLIIDQLNGKNT